MTMRKKKRERSDIIHLHGSEDFYIKLKLILRRKCHRVFSFISAVSGCLLLLLFSVSVFFPPPTATNLFFPRHSSVVEERAAFRVPASGGNLSRDLWSSSRSKFYYGCSNASNKFQTADVKTRPDRYLLIATSGGLNQQRTGIIDAVVAAYILNATLVIPRLDKQSYWKDTSCFAEIFDVDWFISSLSRDVKIIKEIPTKDGKAWIPRTMRVPRKCDPECYKTRVLPVLHKKQAVELTKFDYRLSNGLDPDLQKLRCRVNYHALKFTDPILEMGKLLVERIRMKAKHFIALHLRFEPDMLAFSGCYYGGGDEERAELGMIRKRWKTLHVDPEKVRRKGKCPLTPEEVSLMLRALGFGSNVHVYVASGEIYGGEESLAPFKALFPNFHSKQTIATNEELAQFSSFSGRMAALDYIVCDESDVFVTNNNGNMARMLSGRRRYFGHKPTIRPNAKKLHKLFMDRNNTTWEEFSSKVRTSQIGFTGAPKEAQPGKDEFHENPDSCLCQTEGVETIQNLTSVEHEKKNRMDALQMSYEYDPDWIDDDYLDSIGVYKGLPYRESSVVEEFSID
ncbi:NAD(P)-binding Rossmann-fold superfamily protein [Hibiscus syriacus]|uniref:O-fucosyltransferase family protein n=1 Tax=Hibiscus syriacus TaxID=106335 RepID=A0A6A2Z4X0_HIBSY|nr:NAD(P)-binding Rossmann-fold superfamily protein [Hibiscus syriacus]